jgi:hypothetical protein
VGGGDGKDWLCSAEVSSFATGLLTKSKGSTEAKIKNPIGFCNNFTETEMKGKRFLNKVFRTIIELFHLF